MKSKFLLIMMLCFTVLTLNVSAQDKKEKQTSKKEVTFDVSMTCDNCKRRIEKNIAFEKGVSDMKVDLPTKTVMVVYNFNKTDEEKLRKAIEKLGYEVKVHEEDAE